MNPLQQQLQQLEQQLLQAQQMLLNVRGNYAAEQQLNATINQLQNAIQQVKLQLHQQVQYNQVQYNQSQYHQGQYNPRGQYNPQQPVGQSQYYQPVHNIAVDNNSVTTTNLGSNSKYANCRDKPEVNIGVPVEKPDNNIKPDTIIDEPTPLPGHEFEPLAIGDTKVTKMDMGGQFKYKIDNEYLGVKMENIIVVEKEWSTFTASEVGVIPVELRNEMKLIGVEKRADVVICEANLKRSCLVEAGNTSLAKKMYNSEEMPVTADSVRKLIIRLFHLRLGNTSEYNKEFFNIVIKDLTKVVNDVLTNTVNFGVVIDNIVDDYDELTDVIATASIDTQDDISVNLANVVNILSYTTPTDDEISNDEAGDKGVDNKPNSYVDIMTWYENKSIIYFNNDAVLDALESYIKPGKPKILKPSMPGALYNTFMSIKDKLETFNKSSVCHIIGKTKNYTLRTNIKRNYLVITEDT